MPITAAPNLAKIWANALSVKKMTNILVYVKLATPAIIAKMNRIRALLLIVIKVSVRKITSYCLIANVKKAGRVTNVKSSRRLMKAARALAF